MLSFEELTKEVDAGDIDTVVVAFTDMQGRLMGKRMEAHFFLGEMEHKNPIEGCNYLLALEMEMDPVPGYEIASWERGYGDFSMVPDFSTMRRIPWLEGTALVLCDVAWNDGSPVRPSPRQVLKAQVDRAAALGYKAMFGSELEFFLHQGDLRAGPRPALPRPHSIRAVHPRLPHPRNQLRRALHPVRAQRHAGSGDARRDVEGRGVAGTARD